MTTNRFGILLRQIRETSKPRISQTKLSVLVGCDHSYISRLEEGNRDPSRDFIFKVAENLKLNDETKNALLISAGYLPTSFITGEHSEQLSDLNYALEKATGPSREKALIMIDILIEHLGHHRRL